MTLVDTLGRPLKATPDAAALYPQASAYGVPTMGPISFQGWPDRVNTQRTLTDEQRAKAAAASAWVYSDVRAIANEVSTAELSIKQATGGGDEDVDQEVENHPFEDLWVRPNPFMGRSFLMQYWTWQLELLGKAYLFFAPVDNDLAEIWPVPSLFLTPEGDAQTFIKRYKFQIRPDVPPIYIDPQFICYSRFPNPFNIRDGMSPLVAAFLAVETDAAMGHWNRDFFGKDNAVPTSIVSLPKETSKPQYELVKAELFEFFGSGQRRTAVIRAGDMDVQTITAMQKDMEFISGRGFSREEIDRVYGIPGGYWSATSNRANANHAKGTLIDNAVWPLLVMLHEDLNTQIIPHWYGDQFTADFEDIRPRDQEMDLKELEAHKSHWTIAELREHDKKKPLNDWRDTLFLVQVPAGTTTDPALKPPAPVIMPGGVPSGPALPDNAPLDSAVTPADVTTPAAMVGKAADLVKWQRKALKRLRDGKQAQCPFESEYIDDEESTLIVTALAEATSEEAVKAAFGSMAGRQQDDRADLDVHLHQHTEYDLSGGGFTKAATVVALTPAETALMDRIRAILTQHGKTAAASVINGSVPALDTLSSDLRAAMQTALLQTIVERATALADEIGVDFDPVTMANAASDWASTYTFDRVKGIAETTQALLQKAISAYQSTPGMTQDDVKAKLAAAFGEQRASVLAITEITRASAQGVNEYQSYLTDAGVTMLRRWGTNNDDLQCSLCGPMNGLLETAWPEDAMDGPPLHPRCRCSLTLTVGP